MCRSTQPTDFRLSIHNRTVGARFPRPMVWGTYEWVGEPNPYERLCVCVVAVSGFTTILGDFSGIGIRARLSCGRVVLDVPFNPTYGFPPIHSQSNRRGEGTSPHGLGNVRMGWGTQPLRKIVRLCSPLDCRVVIKCQQNLAVFTSSPQMTSFKKLDKEKQDGYNSVIQRTQSDCSFVLCRSSAANSAAVPPHSEARSRKR